MRWSRGAYDRDYLDTAAVLERYNPAELIGLARRLDPGLDARDFAEAGQRLDHMPDYAFTSFGLSQQDVARLRERFASWPRGSEAVGAETAKDADVQLREPRDARRAEPQELGIEPEEPDIES